MKSIYVVACSAMMMLSTFTACSDDNNTRELTPEQIAYYEKNREYIREKKLEKNENGEFVYQQLKEYGDTTLYRIINRKAEKPIYPTSNKVLKYNLEGHFIDGTTFQKKDTMNLAAEHLIVGLRAVILDTSIGDSIEAIIPSSLGYDYQLGSRGIPIGSTLIFTYRVEEPNP